MNVLEVLQQFVNAVTAAPFTNMYAMFGLCAVTIPCSHVVSHVSDR